MALLPLSLIAWRWVRQRSGALSWQRAIDPELLQVMLSHPPSGTRRTLAVMVTLGVLCFCLALAGPAWQRLPQPVEQRNDGLIILYDLSLSMLAQDVKPSRVDRARQKITDILRTREEGLTALVAYAGDAHAVVPLTDDVATIENLLGALGPEMMPVPGSNPDHALQLAHELFANGNLQQGRILIVTDGIDNINSVSRHRNAAFPISILGIGTQDGGPIPLDKLRQPGRYLLSQEGNQIVALLDHQRLRDVANLTYGHYEPAQLSDNDFLSALQTPLPGEDDTLEVERDFDTWYDQGHWLVLLLVPVLLMAFRRGSLLTLGPVASPLLATLLLLSTAATTSPQVHAAAPVTEPGLLSRVWESLWYNTDQRAHRALRYGEPERAVTLFEDPQWRATANYRSGEYPTALQEFAQDTSVTGQYNQGNSLARLGDYEQALAQYNQVLALDPSHEDARYNKELIERLLQEQQDAEAQENDSEQDQANNEESDEQQDQQQQDQEQSDQSQQDQSEEEQEQQEQTEQQEQQQQDGEAQQAQAEQEEMTRDEKQEALEQWIRRVPDDPGGLLKRKFTHETKQRLRRGEYENRQGEKIW